MNLPNRISLLRLMLVPFMTVIFLVDAIPYNELIGGLIFLVASLTDGIDGHIARKYNMVTTLGKFLDSIADKVLCMVALILIVFKVPVEKLGLWIVALTAITIAREFLISALRQIAASKNIILAADKWGKVKAVFQYIAFPFLMVSADLSSLFSIDVIYLYTFSFVMFAISTFFAILSAINYLYKNRSAYLET